eukprot:CAMPEP_0194216036 /NCGR_PEP_ID=MMETSP0156-20130528/18224_1 /TAXON_ID=33649 /ORGANISM="Thalassionema nitzschioides, Strain L26-B" /LENGTH=354 /DNA_ID=CAMNT_0038944705 /DNA_START=14 /DNA_END=1075 /DNA_ORIENTATION=-
MPKVKGSEEASPAKSFVDGITNWERKKTTILKACVFFVVYMVVGAFIYSAWFEETTFIDALYFTSITASTVGYGDVLPATDGQKVFTTFYLLLGVIVILGVFVTILVDDLFDSVHIARQKARDDGDAHVLDKVQGGTNQLPELEARILAYWRIFKSKIPYLVACFVPPIIFAIVENNAHEDNPAVPQWNWVDVIYYTVTTATTIGYGDVVPRTEAIRLVCVFYVPFCVVTLTMVMSAVSNVYMTRKTNEAEKRFLQRKMKQSDLNAMDMDMDGVVSRAEFLLFMIMHMGKVEEEFIDKLKTVFDQLDKDKTGTLTVADLMGKMGINHDNGPILMSQISDIPADSDDDSVLSHVW